MCCSFSISSQSSPLLSYASLFLSWFYVNIFTVKIFINIVDIVSVSVYVAFFFVRKPILWAMTVVSIVGQFGLWALINRTDGYFLYAHSCFALKIHFKGSLEGTILDQNIFQLQVKCYSDFDQIESHLLLCLCQWFSCITSNQMTFQFAYLFRKNGICSEEFPCHHLSNIAHIFESAVKIITIFYIAFIVPFDCAFLHSSNQSNF